MDQVVRLPEAVANQIAAGEVVERPASVVKELVENALDAGATRVEVDVEQGGQRWIRVADDGQGMSPGDAVRCLERHATSKIRTAEDLVRVRTLGFRGEALPSIASVCRFRLVTRRPEDEAGIRVTVEGTGTPETERVGAPAGTVVEVEDLFFNVPARRKFMRRPATEMGHVTEAVTRLALAWPRVAFRLRAQDRTVLDAPATDPRDPAGRLGRILGRAAAERLLPIPADDRAHAIGVEGYVSEPGFHERTSRSIYAFLNGRFIRDRGIHHAVVEPYRTLIERGRFPVAVLWLTLDPETFDVNVHPQKTEVRFRDPRDLHRAVFGAISRALDAGLDRPAPAAPSRWAQAVAGVRPSAAQRATAREAQAPLGASEGREAASSPGPIPMFLPRASTPSMGPAAGSGAGPSTPPGPTRDPAAGFEARDGEGEPRLARAPARPLGLAFGRYLVAEEEGRLVVVDLRAVLERRHFEVSKAGARPPRTQRLLVPRVVELSPVAAERARDLAGELAAVGFEVEDFGGNSLAVLQHPADLADRDVEALLIDLLADEPRGPDSAGRRRERWARRTARAAARAVPTSREAWSELLSAMEREPALRRSLDGRPTRVDLSASAVERLFEDGV